MELLCEQCRRPTKSGRGGLPKRFCSARCQRKNWMLKHPHYARDWYTGKGSKYRRNTKLRSRYGVNDEWVEGALAAQGGVCGCCGGPPDEQGWYIDHEHVSGFEDLSSEEKLRYLRGILCRGCNSMLGFAYDEPRRLMAGVSYLERFNHRVPER